MNRKTHWPQRISQVLASIIVAMPVISMIPGGAVANAAAASWTNITGPALDLLSALAVNSAGDLFVTSLSGTIAEGSPTSRGTYTWQTISTDAPAGTFSSPYGIAVNSAGDLFVTNNGSNTIVEGSPASGGTYTWQTIAANASPTATSPFDNPNGITVNSAGDLFVTNDGNNTVVEGSPASGGTYTWQTIGPSSLTGSNYLEGIAVSGTGNLFVANYYGTILEGSPAGGGTYTWQTIGANASSTATSPFDGADGIAVNSAGNLFVTNYVTDTVVEGTSASGGTYTWQAIGANASSTATTPFNGPSDIVVDSVGDLFVVNYITTPSPNAVTEYKVPTVTTTPPTTTRNPWSPPVITPTRVTVGGSSFDVIGNLGYNPPQAIQAGTAPGYVEERAALQAGVTMTGEGVDSGYLVNVLDGSGVGLQQHVTAVQQGQFAALYQKLAIIPTWTDNTVSIPKGVAALIKAGAPTLAIENYLVQLDGFSWASAQAQAQAGFPIQNS